MKREIQNVPAQAEELVSVVQKAALLIEMIETQMMVNHEQNAAYFCLIEEIVNGNVEAGSVEFF
jgi:hypothetical protein